MPNHSERLVAVQIMVELSDYVGTENRPVVPVVAFQLVGVRRVKFCCSDFHLGTSSTATLVVVMASSRTMFSDSKRALGDILFHPEMVFPATRFGRGRCCVLIAARTSAGDQLTSTFVHTCGSALTSSVAGPEIRLACDARASGLILSMARSVRSDSH